MCYALWRMPTLPSWTGKLREAGICRKAGSKVGREGKKGREEAGRKAGRKGGGEGEREKEGREGGRRCGPFSSCHSTPLKQLRTTMKIAIEQ